MGRNENSAEIDPRCLILTYHDKPTKGFSVEPVNPDLYITEAFFDMIVKGKNITVVGKSTPIEKSQTQLTFKPGQYNSALRYCYWRALQAGKHLAERNNTTFYISRSATNRF